MRHLITIVILVLCFGCADRLKQSYILPPDYRGSTPLAVTISMPKKTLYVKKKLVIPVTIKNVSKITLDVTESYYGEEIWIINGKEAFLPIPCRMEKMSTHSFSTGESYSFNRTLYWTKDCQLYYSAISDRHKAIPALQSNGMYTVKLRLRLSRLVPGALGFIESNQIKIKLDKRNSQQRIP